ncbi:MAG TPA: glycosyltransferase [Caldisericia bacterium]|nr:glycosyltransferase [Caldisericia bacterium]
MTAYQIYYWYSLFIFVYFFVINAQYIILILISFQRLREYLRLSKTDFYVATEYTPSISIIVPARNEEHTIVETVISLFRLDYPDFEIVVVNDGSTDSTLDSLIDYFELKPVEASYENSEDWIPCETVHGLYSSFVHSHLLVVDKKNGGKSDALNAGINFAKHPLFCSIDADSILEKQTLLKLVQPFLNSEETVAVGGIVRVANGCTIRDGVLKDVVLPLSPLIITQIIEYLRAFLTNRVGWEKINSLVIISGAIGLFKRSVVMELGGYKHTIGEDMELTLRMHKHLRQKRRKYRIDFAPDAVCWTQVPTNLKSLSSQRIRWQRGMIDSLWTHKDMLFNPRYGTVGFLALPYFWFFEMMGPAIEASGYVVLLWVFASGVISDFFVFVFLMAYLFGLFFSLVAIFINEISYNYYKRYKEILKLILYAMLDPIWYRPFTVYWRIKAFLGYTKGRRSWGTIKRETFLESQQKAKIASS